MSFFQVGRGGAKEMSTQPGTSPIRPPPPPIISAEVQAATVSAASHHHLVDSSGYVDSETWNVKNARIIALRKEKSRDAARSRRGKENYEFYELAKMLPLPAAITSQLDKASIIRLTISYLRMRDFSSQGDPPWHSYIDMPPSRSVLQGRFPPSHSGSSAVAHELYEHNLGSHILQSLDGFLFSLCSDGRFLYISETVSIYLGLSQVELTGSSIFDYVHPGDHAEVAEQLGMKLPPTRMMSPTMSAATTPDEGSPSAATSPVLTSPSSPSDNAMNMSTSGGHLERSFIIRMKSTLCKRGIQITSSGYKVIHITGSLRTRMMLTQYTRHPPVIMGFVAMAYSLPPPTISEIHLDPTMFVCKVDLNLNITFCEAKISEFLDYVSEDVMNKSLYSFLHAQDIASIRDSHSDLLNKGQVITKYFRWMCKAGGFVWMQATATLTYSKNSNDKSFIFINQVLSKIEDIQSILDISQMSTLPPDLKSDSSSGDSPEHESDSPNLDTKKSGSSPRSSESSHKDHSKKSSDPSSKPTKGRRRKCNPESKESKKRKIIRVAPSNSTGTINNNGPEDQISTILSVGTKVKDHNESGKNTPLSSPVRTEEEQPLQESTKKPKIYAEEPSDQDIGDIQVTNVLDRTLVEERGGTPSTELTTSRLSPMIATQPNGHHASEPELPVGNRCASDSWDNPPNKEIPTHNHHPPRRDSLIHVHSPEHDEGNIGGIIKSTYSKHTTTPTPPESILTPPLSDSAKSQQFTLSSTGGGEAGGGGGSIVTSLRQDHIDVPRTSPLTANSSSYANSTSYANSSTYAKSFLTASRAELASSHPALLAKSPTAAAYDMLDSQSSSLKQETALYNAHPRVITAVSSAYGSMAYGNYGQYNNFQQYGSPVNLAAAHTYQTNPYGDPSMYKNYRSGHELQPMDLSYNNVAGFSNAAAMSLLHSNVSATGASHPYFHPSKMSYSASDGGLHSIHDKSQVEEAVRIAQQKV